MTICSMLKVHCVSPADVSVTAANINDKPSTGNICSAFYLKFDNIFTARARSFQNPDVFILAWTYVKTLSWSSENAETFMAVVHQNICLDSAVICNMYYNLSPDKHWVTLFCVEIDINHLWVQLLGCLYLLVHCLILPQWWMSYN